MMDQHSFRDGDCQAFATATKEGHRPRRSILFLNVTGEEKGLWAQRGDHPIFPTKNTVNNINIDMVEESITNIKRCRKC
jgi:hypothetical protein